MSLISDVSSELKNLKSDKKTLRKFGFTIAAALGVIGLLVFFVGSHSQRAFWLWGAGALFLVFGELLPASLKYIHIVWMGLAFVLGWIVSRLILSVLFYLVITPIGLIMRLFGKDPLDREIDRDAVTYWKKRESQEIKPERYEKLF
ncbi:hypothetical protein GWO43_21650 [candidate division KSB1 bacterium]|nr:hypothetical protein [candidate division KSB1 bacterium]NIR72198.1 hypothetical protein [candidate division KSB1 bacterium]NIS26663.1 hypothetical protein [candidate division KSB1 bacterium]NIT73431.1 hypothetical protein [candidate division KSB1 bacterium]NIU27279.1 hypothetical protein [candidate division KSB1 bacterium]